MFMAKDNVPFHSIMFPSTLIAADDGYLLPTNIMATGKAVTFNISSFCCYNETSPEHNSKTSHFLFPSSSL